MKRFKLLTACMATTVGIVPLIPALTGCSCSSTKINELALEIKDATIQRFMDISKNIHRSVWNEQEVFDYIVSEMHSLGYKEYSGRDYWSFVPEVRPQIEKETGIKWEDPWHPFPDYGNVWYDIPASSGMGDAPKIILQAHMDSQMTFASDSAKANWKKNGINISFDRDNDILSGDGQTSLGADGGMGISLLLSIAKFQNKFKHGGIRLLFTAGESEATQHYAAGASFLAYDQLNKGKEDEQWAEQKDQSYLEPGSTLPFGSEKEFAGLISISGLYNKTIYRSVGGINEVSYSDNKLDLSGANNKIPTDSNYQIFKITIDNLHGGKSSKDIDSGYANALQMLMETLSNGETPIQLINASSKPGAYNIASTATCTFVSTMSLAELQTKRDTVLNEFKQKFNRENWNKVKFDVTKISGTPGQGDYQYGLSVEQSQAFIKMFNNDLKFGAIEWFDEQKTSVKTSNNHGKLTLNVAQNPSEINKSFIESYFICRSNIQQTVNVWSTEDLGGVMTILKNGLAPLYPNTNDWSQHISNIMNPCWEGTSENKLIDTLTEGYKKVGITPKVVNNHGWVEIGALTTAFKEGSTAPLMACLGIEINNSSELTESVYTDSLNTLNKSILYTLINIGKIA